jgi:ubiquinone/menaquinone biosynthesis C-methylase UbiE
VTESGTSFSDLQAVVHAWQPMQRLWSKSFAHFGEGAEEVTPGSWFAPRFAGAFPRRCNGNGPMETSDAPTTFKEMERSGWNDRAAVYDERVGRRTRAVAARLLDAVGAGPGMRLLDVCCGPGYSAGEAAERGCEATGVDLSTGMVQEARRLFPRATFRVGDAEALELPDASVDAVVCAFGLLHLPDPERAIAEAFRVLRPGGRYAWTVWCNGAEKAAMSTLVQNAIKTFGELEVGLPPAPPRELFSSTEVARDALCRAGFSDAASEEIALTFRAARVEDVWDWYDRGTVRTAALLHRQRPEALARIKAAILQGAARFAGPDGIVAPHNAIMHVARKPEAT